MTTSSSGKGLEKVRVESDARTRGEMVVDELERIGRAGVEAYVERSKTCIVTNGLAYPG
jgi:hypothetical protein